MFPFILNADQLQPMHAWSNRVDMEGVFIHALDVAAGSPQKGDYIAHKPSDPQTRWLVNAETVLQDHQLELRPTHERTGQSW